MLSRRLPAVPFRAPSHALCLLLAAVGLAAVGCDSDKVPEPEPPKSAGSDKAKTNTSNESAKTATDPGKQARPKQREPSFGKVTPRPPTPVKPTAGDPTAGKFGMEDALKGLSGEGEKLFADIKTSAGTLECELWPDKAPLTVANFVGLARGTRAWKKDDKWVTQPLYDGTVFHRIIKGFMIQGGDPNGDGSGGPGYVIPDEIWGGNHDQRGLICMANRGPDTNGSQFFIMDGTAPHLDQSYTIFGKCGPDALIEKIANTPTKFDRAIDPPKIEKVVVRRGS
jgi:peptidyl-prolyl cis-trans isomerase A (cyclophilin A)